jgi:flagellar biosynthesis GTPase FlhF
LGSAEKSIVFLLLHPGSHTEFRATLRSLNEQKRKFILNTLDIRKLAVTVAVGIIGVLGTGTMTAAQHNDDRDKNNGRSNKQWEKQNKQNAKAERERARLMQQRQADWARYNNQILTSHQRQATYNTRNTQGVSVIFGNENWDQNARYRVYRNGSFYNTDYRGAQLLQNSVNEGYRQGFQAGRADRNGNRRFGWSNSSVYRSGTYGYQSTVARNQYQYYFQQGFQRGYQDGSNSRFDNDYNGQYDYGYYENGSVNILGTILNTILNVRSY